MLVKSFHIILVWYSYGFLSLVLFLFVLFYAIFAFCSKLAYYMAIKRCGIVITNQATNSRRHPCTVFILIMINFSLWIAPKIIKCQPKKEKEKRRKQTKLKTKPRQDLIWKEKLQQFPHVSTMDNSFFFGDGCEKKKTKYIIRCIVLPIRNTHTVVDSAQMAVKC